MTQDKNPQLIVALDCDEVLLEFQDAFDRAVARFLRSSENPSSPQSQEGRISYYPETRLGIESHEKFHVLDKMVEHLIYEEFEAIDGAFNAVATFLNDGARVCFITSVPQNVHGQRFKNLVALMCKCSGVADFEPEIYCADGMGGSKEELFKKVNPDIMVDDRLKHLSELGPGCVRVWVDRKHDQTDVPHDAMLAHHHTHSLEAWCSNDWPQVRDMLLEGKREGLNQEALIGPPVFSFNRALEMDKLAASSQAHQVQHVQAKAHDGVAQARPLKGLRRGH